MLRYNWRVWKDTKTRRDLRNASARVLLLVVLVLAIAFGAYMVGRSQSPATLNEKDKESGVLYAEALDTVRDNYVDQKNIDPKKGTYGAIEGMLDTLGDGGHSRFLTPAEREQNDRSLSGTHVGIGIQLEEKNGEVVVAAPIDGSPAEEAGISSDDVLLAVDGKSVRGDEVSEVVEKVKGPEGTSVELTVRHDGERRAYDLQRAEIDSPVASWVLIPGSTRRWRWQDIFSSRRASSTSARKLQAGVRRSPSKVTRNRLKRRSLYSLTGVPPRAPRYWQEPCGTTTARPSSGRPPSVRAPCSPSSY